MTANSQDRRHEAALLAPLIAWLGKRRLVREGTLLVEEFPWHGRRIDLVTLTRTGVSSAYELKLKNTRRALEQGSLNGISFDRSSIVMASRPTTSNVIQAEELGLGLIQVDLALGVVECMLLPKRQAISEVTRNRVRDKIMSRVSVNDV